MESLHHLNIIVHVIAGSIALQTAAALVIAKTKKGTFFHQRWGAIFLWLLGVVIVTGLIGVFSFGRNHFLLVITVLSGYMGFSGYRAVKTKSNTPKGIDIAAATIAAVTVLYFLYYFKSIGMIWAPGIIYSTVGVLVFAILYDFARYLMPANRYAGLWMYEHIVKMLHAFAGLLSAFSGTVFPQHKPYSQFLPSVFCGLLIVYFIVRHQRKTKKTARTI